MTSLNRLMIFAALGLMALGTGCSIKRLAVNKLGDALAQSGTSLASDEDLELIAGAAPFSLKLMEGLLDESPRHQGLLLAAASGFTLYSYAFVEQRAVEVEEKDLETAAAMRVRAGRLYFRAQRYGLRGLEVKLRGFEKALRADPKSAGRRLKVGEVPLIYWTAAAWASAITLSKDQPEIVADLPIVEALIDRALELDESYDSGVIHTFLVSYEMSRPGGGAEAEARSRRHFERAVELSRGQQAGPFVALAEAVALQNQNRPEFEALLQKALKVDPASQPQWRLGNLVMQRRAQWLLSRRDDLFVPTLPSLDEKPATPPNP